MINAPVVERRYLLEALLGQGGMGSVYRAYDRLTGQMIALKQIRLLEGQNQDTSANEFRLALSNEFRLLASLRHPNIITVLDYGFDSGQAYFTMELLQNPQTILTASRDTTLNVRLGFLVELLQALAYLHRRGVLHRDLKPENVLVDMTGQVKVLDFGLSLMNTQSRSKVQESAGGTLAYMSPELFADEEPSVEADLYAVGVIACEILAGHHPFNLKNMALLINSILHGQADFSDLDPRLEPLLRQLLAKSPDERPATADTVIKELCLATGQTLPQESIALRESFLQAAKFIGRENELAILKEALKNILDFSNGTAQGKVYLISGESGVGKSRLIEELRIRALVSGALVIRGQEISEGGVAYQLWRDPLRRLVLAVDLDDEEASMMKTLVPDIDELLERTIPEPPQLEPQVSNLRLMKVIIDIFQRLQRPTVIVLEDLQWTGNESLAILNRLMAAISPLPILVLASYRHDERADLPALLPASALINLARFDKIGIEKLSVSILGELGTHPQIVDVLHQETEGNVFFLVEIVRALAEEAGQLDRISPLNVHAQRLPKGIQEIVQRRLTRVPNEAYPLLEIIALAGKEIDLGLLHILATTFAPDMTLALWLEACANAAVLEVQEDRWRFSHDKLREALISKLPKEQLKTFHQQLAESIEAAHPEQNQYIPAIAYHYQQAQLREKALHYLQEAGNLAKAAYANDKAVVFYQGAIAELKQALNEGIHLDNPQALKIALYENLGDVLTLQGQQQAAQHAFEQVLSLLSPDDVLHQVQIYYKIAKTCEIQRNYLDSVTFFKKAIILLGEAPSEAKKQWWNELIEVHLGLIWNYYWLNKILEMRELAERIEPALADHARPSQQRFFYSLLALLGLRRDRFTVDAETLNYVRKILSIVGDWEYTIQESLSRFAIGFIHLWHGDFEIAEDWLQNSLKATEYMGDVTNQSRALNYLTVLCRKRKQVAEAQEYGERALKIALLGNMIEYIASAQGNLAWVAFRKGEFQQAYDFAQESLPLFQKVPIGGILLWICLYPLIASELALGLLPEAMEHLKLLLAASQQPQPPQVHILLEAALSTWEQGDTNTAHSQLTDALELARNWGYI